MGDKRTAIYCRVDRGGSPETRRDALKLQRQQLEQYAAIKGLQLSGCYEDNGFPGNDLTRPGLVQLMQDYDAGVFEQVLVVNYNRLYRGSHRNETHWPFQICSLNQLEHNLEL